MITFPKDITELAITHNFPNDFMSVLNRGFNFIDCSTNEITITHKKNLDTLEKNQYLLIIGKYNLSNLSDQEYWFTDIIGFFNGLDKYQYECIRRRDYQSMHNYYIMSFDLPYQPNVTKHLRRIRSFIHR